MIRLYDYILSAEGYKVRLLMSMLGLTYEPVKVDVHPGRMHRDPAFLAINPLGTLPVLEDGEVCLRDAQAILVYLAARHDASRAWLPAGPEDAGRVAMWLAFAGHEMAPLLRLRMADIQAAPVPGRDGVEAASRHALGLLEDHVFEGELHGRRWLVGDRPTIADVAVFPGVALMADCGLPVEDYPALWRWVHAFKRLPGFIVMPGILPPDLADALAA
ncbi:MAG: glutathione S-transferase family protein [Pigmentiphaga sp.]|uniref:glutathione S-transferase family protein n=1 Tax=Pigmentiphaga sp. TaxID=1977564 RepID=UPI0029ADEEE4|nr:glutathione S-transferase family protein [Pigmentiphaga sp.]MDX3906231.1 glutathione S-transferase family protein [Pigmentiphaga sp.]